MSRYGTEEWEMDELQREYETGGGSLATHADSMDEFAVNAGEEFPEQEWLLDPRDVWVKNPKYQGPPGRHPEDDSE